MSSAPLLARLFRLRAKPASYLPCLPVQPCKPSTPPVPADVSSLAFLITGSNCKIIHAHPPHWIPEHTVECFTMPHIIIFALGLITGIIAIVIAFFMSIAATELEPDTKDLLGRAQSV